MSEEDKTYEPPRAEDIDTTHDPSETVAIVACPRPGVAESDRWH